MDRGQKRTGIKLLTKLAAIFSPTRLLSSNFLGPYFNNEFTACATTQSAHRCAINSTISASLQLSGIWLAESDSRIEEIPVSAYAMSYRVYTLQCPSTSPFEAKTCLSQPRQHLYGARKERRIMRKATPRI